jgi:hypothetical protein
MNIPASFHQQRMWFIDHFEKDYLYKGGPVYHNIPLLVKVEAGTTERQLQKAVSKLIDRHEILRTKIIQVGNEVFQSVMKPEEVNIEEVLSCKKGLLEQWEILRATPFLLEEGQLLNIYYNLSGNEGTVLFILHHALVDRASLGIIERDFKLFLLNPDQELPYTLQYSYFSEWQHKMDDDEIDSLIYFWRNKLRNMEVLKFPTDKERVAVHIYEAESMSFELNRSSLLSYCLENDITINALSLAVFKYLLAERSNSTDITIGTLMEVRNSITYSIVGPLDNLVVLRTQVDIKDTLPELAKKVEQSWQEASSYKAMPFDRLVVSLNPQKDMSRTALFDILYHYETTDSEPELTVPSVKCSNQGMGKYDLNLLVKEGKSKVEFILTYNKLYFDLSTIESILQSIQAQFEGILNRESSLLEGVEIF